MEQIPLAAQKRTIIGRKVKQLRRDGFIPAHVFGHKIKTIHLQVKGTDFAKVFEKAGETGIIELIIDGLTSEAKAKGVEKKPVLIRGVQKHVVSGEPLHIDFYQVNLSEKVTVNVPVEIVGQSPAVDKKIGLLLTPLSEIEVEALPTDLPESIEVDISHLENIDDEIKVKDVKVDRTKIQILTDEEQVIAQIGELVTKEMEEVEAEIEAEQAETAETVEGEEGATAEKVEGEGEGEGEEKETEAEKEPEEKKEETAD